MSNSAVTSALDYLTQAVDTYVRYKTDQENLEMQKEAYEWNKEMQLKAWHREDSAVRRRKEDLIGAGMSPVLAAGQGAQSSGPIQVTAPHKEKGWKIPGVSDKIAAALQLMQAKENIAYTRAQKDYIDMQKNVLKHDFDIMKRDGMSSNPTRLPKTLRDIIAMSKNFLGKGNSTVDTTGETYDQYDMIGEKIRKWKEERRARQAKAAHEKYMKEYVDRQAYQAGSRKMFSR